MIEEMSLSLWLVNLFSRRMKKTFNTSVASSEVSFKSLKDVNSNYINKKLTVPITMHTLYYSDNKGNQWNVGFVVEEETRRLLYELWIKNGEPIAYELYE
jgi:hypothetical protein